MATTTTKPSEAGAEEEEYIDMELTSSPKNREFEFQMSSSSSNGDKQTTTYCPADELFYNGKLLPLHTTTFDRSSDINSCYYKILPYTAPCTNTTNTPLDSCNISPSESCRVSCELNPDDYFFQWSTELTQFNGFVSSSSHHSTKKPWSKKLKLIKHSVLGQKLKASRAFFKSLFTKTTCSDEGSANADGEKVEILAKTAKKRPYGYPTIGAVMMSGDSEENNVQRRSFSGAIKWHSPIKCLSSSSDGSSSSSSSFSFNSNGSHEVLRRSSSATEIEGSIEAAIAHCKKSEQVFQMSLCN